MEREHFYALPIKMGLHQVQKKRGLISRKQSDTENLQKEDQDKALKNNRVKNLMKAAAKRSQVKVNQKKKAERQRKYTSDDWWIPKQLQSYHNWISIS